MKVEESRHVGMPVDVVVPLGTDQLETHGLCQPPKLGVADIGEISATEPGKEARRSHPTKRYNRVVTGGGVRCCGVPLIADEKVSDPRGRAPLGTVARLGRGQGRRGPPVVAHQVEPAVPALREKLGSRRTGMDR